MHLDSPDWSTRHIAEKSDMSYPFTSVLQNDRTSSVSRQPILRDWDRALSSSKPAQSDDIAVS